MKKGSFLLILLIGFSSYSQQKKDPVNKYFDQYLTNKKIFNLIEKSLPTLEECKLVFTGENAKTYFDEIQEVKGVIKNIVSKLEPETLTESSYRAFNSNDTKKDNGKSYYGMSEIKDVLKPNITFYHITYKDSNGSDSRFSPFKFFVKLNGKWLFFPKPTRVFRK